MPKTYIKWSEEEKQSFFKLLSSHFLSDAIKIHADNTGRTAESIRCWYYKAIEKEGIPQSVLSSITTKKWSNEEIKSLCQLIAEHPNNFMEAYRLHSEATGRTLSSINTFFGRYRRKQEAKVCMVAIGGKKKNSPNRKNIYAKTGGTVEPMKVSIWKKILKLLFKL